MLRILVTLSLFLGAVVVGFFYTKPGWEQFQMTKVEIETLQKLSSELDELSGIKDNLANSIQTITDEHFKNVEIAIPPNPGVTDLLIYFDYIIARHGMAMKSINFSLTNLPKKMPSGLNQPSFGRTTATTTLARSAATAAKTEIQMDEIVPFSVGLTVIGTYDTYKNLLNTFENNLRIIDIQTTAFAPSLSDEEKETINTTTAGLIWSFKIDLQMYYQK